MVSSARPTCCEETRSEAAFSPISEGTTQSGQTRSLYTVSVPNAKVKRLVVSRFDRGDLTLSEEFIPAVAPESGLKLSGTRRSLDEYYVTGAAAAGGRLYAISAAYSTLLAIDLAGRKLVSAWSIPGLQGPTGLAIKGEDFYIADSNGEVRVVSRPQ